MSCRHCGAPLPDGAMFCGECGRSVSSAVTSASSASRRPAAPVPVVLPRAAPPEDADAPSDARRESVETRDAGESGRGDAEAGDTARIDPGALAGLRRAVSSADAAVDAEAGPGADAAVGATPDVDAGVDPEVGPDADPDAGATPDAEARAAAPPAPVGRLDSVPDAVVGSEPEALVEPRRRYEARARPELADRVEPEAEPEWVAPPVEPVEPVHPEPELEPQPVRVEPGLARVEPKPARTEPERVTAAASASPGPDLPVDLERTRVTRPAEGPTRFVLQFSTGESISVTGSGLVGRNPSAEPGEFVDHLVTVFDAGKSVSKAHLEFGQESGRFWVSDRFSTNGTVIRPAEQEPRRCEPGRRYFVDRGTRVDVGEQFFVVS